MESNPAEGFQKMIDLRQTRKKISELTKKLADKDKERRNICYLLALLVLLISLLCGKIFMLDETKEQPVTLAAATKDDCKQIQKKYEHKISEYSLLQTSMKKAAKDHARQLKIANTDVVAAKKGRRSSRSTTRPKKRLILKKRRRIVELEEKIAAMSKKLENTQNQEHRLESECRGDRDKVAALQNELLALKKVHAGITKEIAVLKKAKDSLSAELTKSNRDLEEARNDILKKQKSIKKYTQTIQDLEKQVKALESSLAEKERRYKKSLEI